MARVLVVWICIWLYLIQLNEARVCAPPDPLVRPACPGSWRGMTETQCDDHNAECCWNDTVDTNYPFCYYVPKDASYGYNIALHKPTFQKSIGHGGVSSRAVDGCSNTDWAGGCCTHTNAEPNIWWSVDLTGIFTVVSVTITTRNAYTYVEKFKVLGSNTNHNPDLATDKVECAYYPGTLGRGTVNRIPCTTPITVRYLIIQRTDSKDLTLCEAQVEVAGRFNAALGKLARQIGNLIWSHNGKSFDTRALKSVDGCAISLWDDRCTSHTGGAGPKPWWSVDLGRQYNVYSVTIKNRANYDKPKDLTILTSNNTYNFSSGDRSVCGKYSSFIAYSTYQNIPCTNPIMARYVIITQPGFPLAMTEVLVEAECAAGKYGISCQSDCHNCRNGSICNVVSGHCPGGLCASGYQGPKCDQLCSGTFGENCVFNCSENCNRSVPHVCDPFSGSCPGGVCVDGFLEPTCLNKCSNNTYGSNCVEPCSRNCGNNNVCHHVDGRCPGNLCKDGYTGFGCFQKCVIGFYGLGCKQNCSGHCKNSEACYFVNGHCPSGCDSGYKGDKCGEKCVISSYGMGCKQNCSGHCKNSEACYFVNGHCPSGCDSGYKGDKCGKKCSKGTYGNSCLQICSGHCNNSEDCHFVKGHCPSGCDESYQGDKCDQKVDHVTGPGGGGSAGAIAGAIVSLIIVIAIAAILVVLLLRRRKQNQRSEAYKDKNSESTVNAAYQVEDNNNFTAIMEMETKQPTKTSESNNGTMKPTIAVKPKVSNEPDEDLYQNANVEEQQKKTLIQVGDLAAYTKNMKARVAFKEEYESIPKSIFPVDEAEKPELAIKNRYKNILPYDTNRVKLQQIGDDKLSDYINASNVKDYQGLPSYIAALGTTDNTLGDFWRMIWEQKLQVIVMVTNLLEEQKSIVEQLVHPIIKCIQYWPETGQITRYDDISVEITQEQVYRYYTIRTFKASKGDSVRQVKQYHYTAWPDKGVPENISGLYKMLLFMKDHRATENTPILIHCSAGVGRTGTIIALDILLDQSKAEGAVDVFNCVHRLREQRTNMIQTLSQYEFIHDALCEILTVGLTAIPCAELTKLLNNNKQLDAQYQLLNTTRPVYADVDLDFGKIDNKDKNRDLGVIPADGHRAKLVSSPETYFNAVYIASFKKQLAYCATQVPLSTTVEEFWRFMYEEQSKTIVCLQNDTKYTQWLPKEKSSIIFGIYSIHSNSVTSMDGDIQKHDVTVHILDNSEYANVEIGSSTTEQEPHTLSIFMIPKWSQTPVQDRDPKVIINLYTKVQQYSGNKIITVMCLNGANETGMYVALSNLFEMAYSEQEVDVFHVVKQIRKKRPQFITSKEQYLFIHRVIQQYMAGFDEYSNIKDI